MFNQQNIVLAISIAVLAVGATLFVLKRIKLRRARSWPTEAGRVESTSVTLETSGSPPNMSSAHVARLTYSYSAQGAHYSGVLRRQFVLKGSADKWIGKYASGAPLSIRYNPNNAKDSVLFENENAGAPEGVKPLG